MIRPVGWMIRAALLTAAACTGLAAQETAVSTSDTMAPAATTAAPHGHFGMFHRMWKHVEKPLDRLVPGQHLDASSSMATGAPLPQGPIMISHIGPVEDITNTGGQSEKVFDPQCKILVAPVGTLGSVTSLSLLAGKIALSNRFHLGSQVPMQTAIEEASARLNWLPAPAEKKIGQALLKHNQDMVLPANSRIGRIDYGHARETLARVEAAAGDTAPYQFSVLVLKESGKNASSLPGGIIELDSDLVDRHWDPEVAYFRVAHEMSHILQRHETESYQALLADSATSIESLKDVIRLNPQMMSTIIQYAHHLQNTRLDFSGQQELQADACAVRLMHKQYPDRAEFSHAMTDVEASLGPVMDTGAPGTGTSNLPGMVKELIHGPYERHPNTRERLQNLRQMASAP